MADTAPRIVNIVLAPPKFAIIGPEADVTITEISPIAIDNVEIAVALYFESYTSLVYLASSIHRAVDAIITPATVGIPHTPLRNIPGSIATIIRIGKKIKVFL